MTIDPKLMSAIFAMDSYNRSYNEGINNITSTYLGAATIIADSEDLGFVGATRKDEAIGFYAIIAYQYDGQVTIAGATR